MSPIEGEALAHSLRPHARIFEASLKLPQTIVDQKLGDAIKEMLKLYRLDEKIDEHKLIRSWEKAVGPLISKHTTGIYISNKKNNI